MSNKPFSCQIDGCGQQFATQAAKNSHRRDKHGARKVKRSPRHRDVHPMQGLDPDFVYSFVEDMDLPDGAHWAMIEDLSGLEPGDFA